MLTKNGLDADEKKEIVRWASAGRATSSKDLTAHEMQSAIEKLSGDYDSRIAKMRAKARAIASDIGLLPMVAGKTDYTALNTFITNKFKAPNLFKLEYDQLRDCITALERWRAGNTKKMISKILSPL